MCSFSKQCLSYDLAKLNVTRNRLGFDRKQKMTKKKSNGNDSYVDPNSIVWLCSFLGNFYFTQSNGQIHRFEWVCLFVCVVFLFLSFYSFRLKLFFVVVHFFVYHFSFRFAFDIRISSFCSLPQFHAQILIFFSHHFFDTVVANFIFGYALLQYQTATDALV